METLQRTANRGSISTGFDIDNSLKLESDNTEYLTYTPSSTTNVKTWTFSCWVKRTELYNGSNTQHLLGHFTDGSNHSAFRFDDADVLELRNVVTGNIYELKTDQVFRDTSAWYHIVIAFDTTQATASNRTKVYVNGNQVTLSGTYTALNQITYINTSGDAMGVGTLAGFGNHFNGYMAEVHHIDGQQLAASDFGEFDEDTGIWKPKAYTGSYGTNGFYLDFKDSASLGADDSGNGNNFTLNNITSVDQATDTPTNNFCLINTLQPADQTVTNGATIWSNTVANSWRSSVANTGVNNGKWYYEITIDTGGYNMVGITGENGINTLLGTYLGASANATNASYGYLGNGVIYNNAGTPTTGLPTFGGGNIISIALDMDNGYLYFAKNGSWVNSGDPTSGSSGTGGWALYDSSETQFFASSIYSSSDSLKYNFGGFYYTTISTAETDSNGMGIFEYAPPSGYYALCSKNLAEFG